MRLSVLFVFCMMSLTLLSQTTQRGLVLEYNEKNKKTKLPGVEIDVRSASSTISDAGGKFMLKFLTLKAGDRIVVRDFDKSGFEIFNKEAVEQWNLSPTSTFVVVMCRSDKFKRLRDIYEKNASANYKRQYNKELNALARLRKDGKIKAGKSSDRKMGNGTYVQRGDNAADHGPKQTYHLKEQKQME